MYQNQKFFINNEVGEIHENKPYILVEENPIKESVLYFVESLTKKGDLQLEFFRPYGVPPQHNGFFISTSVINSKPIITDEVLFESQEIFIVQHLQKKIEHIRHLMGLNLWGRAYRRIENLILFAFEKDIIPTTKTDKIVDEIKTVNSIKERLYKTNFDGERKACQFMLSKKIEGILNLI